MTLPPLIVLQPNDGCASIARAVRRRGVEVHFLVSDGFLHLLHSRGVQGRAMPSPRQDPARWASVLDALSGTESVVISGSDAATEWVSAHREAMPASLKTFETSGGAHLPLMNKHELYRMAAEAGVRTPWMRHVSSRAQLGDLLHELTYPCILKASLGHVAKAVLGVGTEQIDTPEDLRDRASRLLAHDLDFVLTELVPGPESAIEGATTVRAVDGSYPLEFSRHKVRQWRPDYGVGSLIASKHLPDTLRLNRQLLDHVGFTGVSSCETKRHAVNGEVYLIEVNVRVPNGFGVAEACGVDGAWRLYAALAGLPLGPQPPQVDGRKVVFPELDVKAVQYRLLRGEISLADVVRSWRGTRQFGSFDLRDPVPGLALATRLVRNKVRNRLRAARAARDA